MSTSADNLARINALYVIWAQTRGNCPGFIADLFGDRVRLASMDESQPGLAFAAIDHSLAGIDASQPGPAFTAADRDFGLAPAAPLSTRDEAVRYFSGILADWDMVHHSPDHVFAEGDRVAMFGRCGWRHKVTGKVADCRIANFWRFENGKVVEFIDVFDSARAVDAATP